MVRMSNGSHSNGVDTFNDAASKRDMSEDSDAVNDDESEDEEYVVEKILRHNFVKGVTLYNIKWLGWDDESDLTWEPEDNLQNAQDILQRYFDENGGRPEAPSKKRKRTSAMESPTVDHRSTIQKSAKTTSQATASALPSSQSNRLGGRLKKPLRSESEEPAVTEGSDWQSEFIPPAGSWENEITSIDTVEKTYDPVTGKEALAAYVTWNTSHQRKHLTSELKQMCPQLLISFYERHVILTPGPEYDPTTQTEN